VTFAGGRPAATVPLQGLVWIEPRPGSRAISERSVRGLSDADGNFLLGPFPLGEVHLHAFAGPITTYGCHVWRDGRFLWLEPATSLNDINDRGVAVGRVTGDSSGFTSHGAIWPKALTRMPMHGDVR
jgi:hypothetical protein